MRGGWRGGREEKRGEEEGEVKGVWGYRKRGRQRTEVETRQKKK